MFMQEHYSHNSVKPLDTNPTDELGVFPNTPNSMGIGLMDEKNRLLYCNPKFFKLLENSTAISLGEKIYVNQGLDRKLGSPGEPGFDRFPSDAVEAYVRSTRVSSPGRGGSDGEP